MSVNLLRFFLVLYLLPILCSCEDDRQLHDAKEAEGTYEFAVSGNDSPNLPKPAFTLKEDGSVEFHNITIQQAFYYYYAFDEARFAALPPHLSMEGIRGKWLLVFASNPPKHQRRSGYHSLSLYIEPDSVKSPELRAFLENYRDSTFHGYFYLGSGWILYGDKGFLKKDSNEIRILPYHDPDDALLEFFVLRK